MQHKLFRLFFILAFVTGLAIVPTPPSARAAGLWYVSTTGDDNNDCMSPTTPCATINGAIGKASSGDTINVTVGNYIGSGTEVVLIDRSVTLSGGWDAGFTTQSGMSTIDGQNARRAIEVNGAAINVIMDHITVQNSFAQFPYFADGAIFLYGTLTLDNSVIQNNQNSGIYISGPSSTLTVNNSTISNNIAQGNDHGGGIFSEVNNVITINNSTISSNSAPNDYGGGVYISSGSNLTINNSQIKNNVAVWGGGIDSQGLVTINSSTIDHNTATYSGGAIFGGGVYAEGQLTVTNSTISNNIAAGFGYGGGIYSNGPLSVTNSTISGNTATTGGGVYSLAGAGSLNNVTITQNAAINSTASSLGGGIYRYDNSSSLTITNSILSGNTADAAMDCYGLLSSGGYNLIGINQGCNIATTSGDIFGTSGSPFDAKLGSLMDNGGPTFTHALLPESPAVDAGDTSGCKDPDGNLLTADQRGSTRPQGIACDIGAYERVFTTPGPAASLAVVSGSGQTTTLNAAFSRPLRVVALDNQGNRVSGVSVTFTAPSIGASGAFANTGTNTTTIDTDTGGVATASTFTANNQAGAYTVSASTAGLGSVDFGLEQLFRPGNDDFANALPILALPFSDSVDNTHATDEFNEPQGCSYSPQTVWYSFTPAASVAVQVDMAGSSFSDTVLSVYQSNGSGFDHLTPLNCANYDSSINFSALAGTTYYIQASSINSGGGDLHVNLQEIPPPVNDNFVDASVISSLPFDDTIDTKGATIEVGEPKLSCVNSGSDPASTVWYSFTPPTSKSISASIPNADFTPVLSVYTGNTLSGLTEVGCKLYSNNVLTLHANAGTTYFFRAGSVFLGDNGSLQFHLEVTPPPQASFYNNPGDPSKFDTIQFYDNSSDPGNLGIQSFTWDFGDGTSSTDPSPTHKYTADGDYQVIHTVTTVDGRTGTVTQTLQVRTHDMGITKITVPTSANVGQTKTISVNVRNKYYPETVQIDLYKSTTNGFVWVATVTKQVAVSTGNRTTSFSFNYKFTNDDAKLGKVTFKVVATIIGARDAYPSDNTAIATTKINGGSYP